MCIFYDADFIYRIVRKFVFGLDILIRQLSSEETEDEFDIK